MLQSSLELHIPETKNERCGEFAFVLCLPIVLDYPPFTKHTLPAIKLELISAELPKKRKYNYKKGGELISAKLPEQKTTVFLEWRSLTQGLPENVFGKACST